MKFNIFDTTLLDHLRKMSGHEIPVKVNELVSAVTSAKANDLSYKTFEINKHLPKALQREQLKESILNLNKDILLISDANKFERRQAKEEEEEYEEEEGLNDFYYHIHLRLCLSKFSKEEYQEYLNYKIDENDLRTIKKWYGKHIKKTKEITLPKFDLVTDYLAMLQHYDELIFDFESIEAGGEITNPETCKQLENKFKKKELNKLFDLLKEHKYIHETTNRESFIWAFGGAKSQRSDWQSIEWIDTSITRKEPNIQTLYELLYLLGVDKDTNPKNPNNLYRKMEFCFSGLAYISNKNPYSIQQDTERKKLLKTIIEEIEAQK